MCECRNDEPYKPNKYTRHMSMETWRKINRGEQVDSAEIINPGYVNEPGETPRR